MTECLPAEDHTNFPFLREEFARDCTSRPAQLSFSGSRVLDCLLVLLPSYLQPQPTSAVSLFPPRLLLSICDVLQLGRLDSATEQRNVSVLPSVLNKLRDWRLLDLEYRFSPEGIHKLAFDLAEITHERFAPFSSDLNQTSRGRLRVKWVPYDSPCESQDRALFSFTPSSLRSSDLHSVQECAHVPPDLGECHSDATYTSCQTRGTPDSEDASVVVSGQHHRSGFRSGCSACRYPRVSGSSNRSSPPMTSFEQRTPFFDTAINTCVAPPGHRKSSAKPNMTKKTKHHMSLQSTAHRDENELPLPKPTNVPQDTEILFPRQRTHSPRISNTIPSWELFSTIQRRLELNHLFSRPREGDKHTSSHRVASVDLRLPITGTSRLLHSPNHASPIDFHPHMPTPTRAQSFLHSQMNSHELGSVAARVPPQPSNQNLMGSRPGRRLPSGSSSHHSCHHHSTATTTTMPSVKVKLPVTGSVSPPPRKEKGSVQTLLPIQSARSRLSNLSILGKVPSEMGVKFYGRRSIPSTQMHKHTRSDSDGTLVSLPFFHSQITYFKRQQ